MGLSLLLSNWFHRFFLCSHLYSCSAASFLSVALLAFDLYLARQVKLVRASLDRQLKKQTFHSYVYIASLFLALTGQRFQISIPWDSLNLPPRSQPCNSSSKGSSRMAVSHHLFWVSGGNSPSHGLAKNFYRGSTAPLEDKMREKRLRWFGHAYRRLDTVVRRNDMVKARVTLRAWQTKIDIRGRGEQKYPWNHESSPDQSKQSSLVWLFSGIVLVLNRSKPQYKVTNFICIQYKYKFNPMK